MSTDLLIKGFFTAIISGMFSWVVFSRYDSEVGWEADADERQRYLPYIPALLLPIMIAVLIIMDLPYYGIRLTLQAAISLCFGIFLHISVYYLILMLLMPLLRKYISSRACAMLWIIPNYLYYTQQSFMAVPEPLVIIPLNGTVLRILICIWLTGFAAVLLWKMIEHLRFRRRILKDSKEVTDPDILTVWYAELEQARVKKPKYQLVTSPHVRTPLSIGFFARTTRVVLPVRAYSTEELTLILRHEIVHICREDSSNKFFLVFCAAMCWFNPLMWIAMRRSADDLELSCDETVLLEADDDTRRRYADLILRTAGDEQGFTTCLSASASALRYRLKHIVKPRKRHSGAILVGLVFFILCMSCGYVALAYDAAPGAEVIFGTDDPSIYMDDAVYSLSSFSYNEDGSYFPDSIDEAALTAYLAGLELSRMTGNYSFSDSTVKIIVTYKGPDGVFVVTLQDKMLSIIPLYGEDPHQTDYYVTSPVDWDHIYSLLM